MPNFLSKLTSCIHRQYRLKNVHQSIILSESRPFFKLSRFELMPDEILVEIFEYIPLIDLYNCFVNLNFRLNIILRDVHLGIILNQNDQTNKILLNALYYFSKQIYYIHITHYPLLNLKLFSNVRSLIIYVPTKIQLLSINNISMPYLNRLCLGIINAKDQIILCNNLFGSQQFLKLNFCNLFQINFLNNIYLSQYCTNIRILLIKNSTIKDFNIFLSLLPNLYHFEICITNICLTIFEENLQKFSHENLRILKIEFVEKILQLNILNYLLSFVPYVQRFTLILLHLVKIRDYKNLQNILIEKFLQLKQFNCQIDYYCQLTSNQMVKKFSRLKIKFPFFQTIKVIPCKIHEQQCLRKIWINKKIIPIY